MISKLAVGLVADVQRKNVGALLLGVVVVASVPILALAALPVFRVVRMCIDLGVAGISLVLSAVGPLGRLLAPVTAAVSRVVVLMVASVFAIAAVGLFVIFRKLDYQALNLGSLFAPALLPVVAIVIALLAFGPLRRVRERIPSRGAIAAGGAVLALLLPLLALRNALRGHAHVDHRAVATSARGWSGSCAR